MRIKTPLESISHSYRVLKKVRCVFTGHGWSWTGSRATSVERTGGRVNHPHLAAIPTACAPFSSSGHLFFNFFLFLLTNFYGPLFNIDTICTCTLTQRSPSAEKKKERNVNYTTVMGVAEWPLDDTDILPQKGFTQLLQRAFRKRSTLCFGKINATHKGCRFLISSHGKLRGPSNIHKHSHQ